MPAITYTAELGARALGNELGFWMNDADAVTDFTGAGYDLTETGTIQASAVNTLCELMGYSGFSASNYLGMAYNSGYDFGTGRDFGVVGWLSAASTTAAETIFARIATSGTGPGWNLDLDGTTGLLEFSTRNGATKDTVSSVLSVEDAGWKFVACVSQNGTLYLYVDGVLVASTVVTNYTGTLDSATAVLRFGLYPNGTQPFSGDLSLWRILSSAPTAANIKTIYNSEKVLFKPSAVYTQTGKEYAFDFDLAAIDRSSSTIKSVAESIGGQRTTLVDREDTLWNVAMLPVTGIEIGRRRRFLSSAMKGGTFSLDIDGTAATPVNPVSCYLNGDGYTESRLAQTEYVGVSFEAREV